MKNTVLTLGLVTTALLVGCGGNKVDQLLAKQEAIAKKACECEDLTMVSREVCIAMIDEDLPTEAEMDCLRDVYNRHSDVLDGPADCVIDAANDFESCVDAASCNAAALQTCSETYGAVSDTCPEPPADVQAETEACFI
jgi:hypothetical protein